MGSRDVLRGGFLNLRQILPEFRLIIFFIVVVKQGTVPNYVYVHFIMLLLLRFLMRQQNLGV